MNKEQEAETTLDKEVKRRKAAEEYIRGLRYGGLETAKLNQLFATWQATIPRTTNKKDV